MTTTTQEIDFDTDYYMQVNKARDSIFRKILPTLIAQMNLRTAIDLGCGIGYYASFLRDMGLEVTGLDGRVDNIALARSRYPGKNFVVADIEQVRRNDVGQFDLVFCAGLLYHLENPFKAIRNIRDMCRAVCVVESRVHWSNSPVALLVQEGPGPSQALNRYAMVLSGRALVRMIYASGFEYVYKVEFRGSHEELKDTIFRGPRRHFWVASFAPIEADWLRIESRVTDRDMLTDTPFEQSWKRFLDSLLESFRWLL